MTLPRLILLGSPVNRNLWDSSSFVVVMSDGSTRSPVRVSNIQYMNCCGRLVSDQGETIIKFLKLVI